MMAYQQAVAAARPGRGLRVVSKPRAPKWTKSRRETDRRQRRREEHREEERRASDPLYSADRLLQELVERWPFLARGGEG